jgi:tetratricopeptide (TPR) repeat protein
MSENKPKKPVIGESKIMHVGPGFAIPVSILFIGLLLCFSVLWGGVLVADTVVDNVVNPIMLRINPEAEPIDVMAVMSPPTTESNAAKTYAEFPTLDVKAMYSPLKAAFDVFPGSIKDRVNNVYVIVTELAKSYNQAGEYQKAIDTLLSHAFVPCEGGEHAIADQYMFAYLAMGIQAMKAGDFAKALELLRCGQILPQSLGAGIWNHCKRIPLRYYAAICHEKLGNREEAEAIYRYISETQIEYFSNMHLGELPYYQALSFDRLGMPLHSRKLMTEYRRRWSTIKDVKDNGFFATTPFFMSFVDAPEQLRRARYLYLTGLCESYLGNTEEASARLMESFALNNDQLIATLYVE